MKLQDLKNRTPEELLEYAEELEIENSGSMRKQEMMFAILKQLTENGEQISGVGVLEVLQDGFGFLRSPEENYLPGPDDIYVSPAQIVNLVYAQATSSRVKSAPPRIMSVILR